MAASVLVWSLAPPPVQHRHEGGADLSHHHDGAVADHYGIDGADESHHAHHGAPAKSPRGVSEVIAEEAPHLHFQWLGFRLTLPDDDGPTQNGDDRNNSKLLFVQAGRMSLPQSHWGTRLDKSPTHPCLDTPATDVAAICPAISCHRAAVTVRPLCDRARHERSGVLLA